MSSTTNEGEDGATNNNQSEVAREKPGENATTSNNSKKANEPCLYRGKNFVFDPRRTDPVIGRGIATADAKCDAATGGNDGGYGCISLVGRCVVCSAPHDDYDNGHAPCEEREARCRRCRVLVLVCDGCRERVRCWGEDDPPSSCVGDDDEGGTVACKKVDLFCGKGGKECIDEGNVADQVEIARF